MPAKQPALLRREGVSAKARTAVVLWTAVTLLASTALTGCEYTYDDGWQPPEDATVAPIAPDPGPARDWWRRDPVSEADLGAWLEDNQMGADPAAVHSGQGLLRAQEVRTEATVSLPVGAYVLTLACRSQRRVTFTVRDDERILVDLSLRCESLREELLYLYEDSALNMQVEARSPANFAYRLTPR